MPSYIYTKKDVGIDAGQWVEEVDYTHMMESMEPDNCRFTPVMDFEYGGMSFKGIEFSYEQNVASTYPGPEYCLCLATKTGDTILDYNVYYWKNEKTAALDVLEEAVESTILK